MAEITFAMTSAPANGSLTYTSTDTDMQGLLDWAADCYGSLIQQIFNPTWNTPEYKPIVPTNEQIAGALFQGTINAWIDAEQRFRVQQPTTPPPMEWQPPANRSL